MFIENEFDLKQKVYLKTDKDQSPRLVKGIKVFPEGDLIYTLVCGNEESYHFPFEISADKAFNIE